MLLFHGGTEIVEKPLCHVGRQNLDFGQGFYLTDLKEQSLNWAIRHGKLRNKKPIINVYSFDKISILNKFSCLIFDSYNKEWLDFIVKSRNSEKPWKKFDYIEGGIADDRVVDTVVLYSLGLLSATDALQRLAFYSPNNQICILNQNIIDKYLKFEGYE
ncbi:MAG: DUF3990 domain-containing protein [Bacteroidales bacterium]|nr:DUF3990 domain-containing protein [Bacteroidales bacterium]